MQLQMKNDKNDKMDTSEWYDYLVLCGVAHVAWFVFIN